MQAGVMANWMGWASTPKRTSTPNPEESDSENDSDDLNESYTRDKKSASDHSDVSDITFASLDASYNHEGRRAKAKQLDKSFSILTDHIKDNDLDISDLKDINHEFGLNDSVDSIDLSKTPFDELKTGSLDDSKDSLLENWNKKFDEWRTPKKELFLAKLIKTINMTEESMKDHFGGIIPLTKYNPAGPNHPDEQHRSSINGRVVDDHQIRHPTAQKDAEPTTEKNPFSRHNKNSLSNDSLAFTLVYCSVFLVTLFYIGYKLTKKWRNQDEEAAAGTVHLVGANGYVCNHTLCREARARNQALYGSVEGPHNTSRCGNSCEFCKRLNQPPPSYSKLDLEETEPPPAYNEEMDRECVCRRSQNSRVSLCLYQNSADSSQEAQNLQRSASEAGMVNTSAGSHESNTSAATAPGGGPSNQTAVTVHPAPSYLMQPAPSYADFPKPGEMKTAGHTRGSMENIPANIINTPRVIHHPIFTVDEEESDDESITVHTPILSSNNSLNNKENTTTPAINNTTVTITNELAPSAPSSENVVNNVLTTIVNNAVTNIEDSAIGANNCAEESKQTTGDLNSDKNGGNATNKDDIFTADRNLETVTVGSAPVAAECVNATSSVESSSIIIEKSR